MRCDDSNGVNATVLKWLVAVEAPDLLNNYCFVTAETKAILFIGINDILLFA